MKIRSFLFSGLFLLIAGSLPISAVAARSFLGSHIYFSSDTSGVEDECPPVTGIEVEFSPDGSALITWNPVLNTQQYTITVEDEHGAVLVNTVVSGTQFTIDGLEYGMEYTITICYIWPYTGEPVCGYKKYRYVIIEDIIVMLDGKNCTCSTSASTTSGPCLVSPAKYSLASSKIYHIELASGEKISFVYSSGHLYPVGSCTNNYQGKYAANHSGVINMAYYKFGNAKIFFHGSYFCIVGASVTSITSCNIIGSLVMLPSIPDNPDNADVTAFPNPFTDELNVEIPGSLSDAATATLQLFDARGQQVLEEFLTDLPEENSTIRINTAGLTPGIYWLIVIRDGAPPLVIRLVKVE